MLLPVLQRGLDDPGITLGPVIAAARDQPHPIAAYAAAFIPATVGGKLCALSIISCIVWSVRSIEPFWNTWTLTSTGEEVLAAAFCTSTSRFPDANRPLKLASTFVAMLSRRDWSTETISKVAKYSPPLWRPSMKTSPNRSRSRVD